MSVSLRHFTFVGDEQHKWWKRHQEAEVEEELPPQPPVAAPSRPHPFTSAHSFREALRWLMTNTKFQIVIIFLIILDALFVLIELLLDLNIIHPDEHHIAPRVFHYMSLSVLSFFVIELAFKLYAFRLEYFHHKFEVLDGIVIVISFVLDIVYIAHEDAFTAVGLLILLRLWRVARIINGIIVSIQSRAEERISKLREANEQLNERVTQLQLQNVQQEQEIVRLQKILEQNKIFPMK